MALGGQNAPIGNIFDEIPIIYIEGNWQEIADFQQWLWSRRGSGEVVGIRLRVDCAVCYGCRDKLRRYYDDISPTLYFYATIHIGYCDVCGVWENDDIPF
jgi:hypothetical protein